MNGEEKPLDLDALEAAAMSATQGEWHWVNSENDIPRQPGEWRASLRTVQQYQTKSGFTLPKFILEADEIRDENMDSNADFIAAANPSVVLRLIGIARHAKLLAENLRIAQGLAKATVTAVTISPGDVLVIRVETGQTPATMGQFAELSRNLSQHFPEGTPVILTNDVDISALDEAAMRQAGWVKASTPMTAEQRLDIIKRHLKPRTLITHKRCAGIIEEHRFTGWSGQWICGNPTKDSLLNGTSRFKADDIAPNNITHIGRVPVEALDYLVK